MVHHELPTRRTQCHTMDCNQVDIYFNLRSEQLQILYNSFLYSRPARKWQLHYHTYSCKERDEIRNLYNIHTEHVYFTFVKRDKLV